MEQFRMKDGAFKAVRLKWIFIFFPLFLACTALSVLKMSRVVSDNRTVNWTFFEFAMPVGAVVVAWGIYQALVRERVVCEDYLVTIDQKTITRDQFGADSITIGYNEITKITKKKNGTLIIMRSSLTDAIIVPPQIENRDKLEFILSGIMQFS